MKYTDMIIGKTDYREAREFVQENMGVTIKRRRTFGSEAGPPGSYVKGRVIGYRIIWPFSSNRESLFQIEIDKYGFYNFHGDGRWIPETDTLGWQRGW